MVDKNFIKFTWSVLPDDVQFSRVFETMRTQLDDLSEPFVDMADSFYRHMKMVFAFEGAVEGRTRWLPLSPAYEVWKKRAYPSAKILHLTGTLERSLTEKGAPKGVLDIRPMSLSVGTSVSYAMTHQLGIKATKYIIPQRKIIELTDPIKTEWTHIMHAYIYKKQTEHWRKIKPDGN